MWNYGHFWMEMVEYFIEPAELAFAGHAGTDASIGTEVKGGKGSAATAEQSTGTDGGGNNKSPGFEAGLVSSARELLTRLALWPDDVRLGDVIQQDDKILEGKKLMFNFRKVARKFVDWHEIFVS